MTNTNEPVACRYCGNTEVVYCSCGAFRHLKDCFSRPQPKPVSGEVAEAVKYLRNYMADESESIGHRFQPAIETLIQAAQQPAEDVGGLLGNYTGGYSGPSGATSSPPPAAQISGMVGEDSRVRDALGRLYLLANAAAYDRGKVAQVDCDESFRIVANHLNGFVKDKA